MDKHAVLIRIPEEDYLVIKASAERINIPVASFILISLQPLIHRNKEYLCSVDCLKTNEKRD